jgi:hypothetical protein
MTSNDKDDFLDDLLTGEELSDFRRASLDRGIAQLRVRRKRHQITLRAAIAGVPLLLLALAVTQISKSTGPTSTSDNWLKPSPPVQLVHQEIKWITDDELFALFNGRPMALVGKPGEQQLVFLDQRSSDFLQ